MTIFPTKPLITVCLIATLFLTQSTTATSSSLQTSFRLGQHHDQIIRGIVEIKPQPNEPKNVVNVNVYYQLGKNKTRTNRMDACESYTQTIRTGAYRFTKENHQQLFVTTTLGRVCTHIYDLSGNQIRAIYSMENGRIVVTPKHNRSGGYDLEESWPKNQWEDHEDLGAGHYDSKSNCVRRLLHWNGTQFVPSHPGPSSY